MNNNKLPGADGLRSRVLKEIRYEIAQLLMGGCKSVVYIILSVEEAKFATGLLYFLKASGKGTLESCRLAGLQGAKDKNYNKECN